MDLSKQQDTYQENKRFISHSYTSKEEFVREYQRLYSTKRKSQELYLLVLADLEKATIEDNINRLKKLSNLVSYISEVEDQITLQDAYDNANNPIKTINLVILACKHNKERILKYLFSNDTKILNNLSVGIGRDPIPPTGEDESFHNAFYYAIRSDNVELLNTLIDKWPGDYFASHLEELDEVLSKAYEELMLRNVPLTEEMDLFVKNKLINLRFFSDTSVQSTKHNLNNVKERVRLVLENISLLRAEYLNVKGVDEKFLFIAKFVAQNIHVLKRQLKSTYDRLPWEEIEFCLLSLAFSHTKQQELNLFYNAIMNKSKILKHLDNFAKQLEGVTIGKLSELPKLKRNKVVAAIISKYPQFEELYSDYQEMKDIYSLDKISNYIKLALSTDPKQREGQIIITRVLQVIGEYLKNTLESPRLSSTTSELLLLSLPKNTREVFIDLRNSLSHIHSLSKRTQIEENADVKFFVGVQNDTKRIDNVITEILYNKKFKMIKILLQKITNSESFDEMKEIAQIFSNVELEKMVTESSEVTGHEKLEKLTKELSDNITDKTNYEKELFNKINNIISYAKSKSQELRTDYVIAFASLQGLLSGLNENMIGDDDITEVKFFAHKALHSIPYQIQSDNLKELAELIRTISHCARSRTEDANIDEVNRLTCEIFYIAEFGIGDLKWIGELRDKLNDKGSFIPTDKQRKVCNITEEQYNNQLELKLSELKSILRNNELFGKLIEIVPSYKGNKKLQAVVEMLVLDIMSILGRSGKHLENNMLFLDENTPLLVGKCLRNHLAHGNTLVEVLLPDSSTAVLLNAKNLISKNITKCKIGQWIKDDPCKLRHKYNQSLITIINQENMFAALKEGNFEDLKSCLRNGADIKSRNIHSSTTLHFAAQGPSPEIIKFILDQKLSVNVKDVKGQTPLHIAAAHGRKNIVNFFITVAGICLDVQDNSRKTPLHIAAENGHTDTVDLLLRNNVNTNTKSIAGFSPLHYAIKNNHIDVAKLMLENEGNIDITECMGGITSLHMAAEHGCLELVNVLLRNKANINARNDRGGSPLVVAVINGHLKVVECLILNGADINVRAIDGHTPLHYAIENGHEQVAYILLKHGANINAINKAYNTTPLHYAAKHGHDDIVMALLKNKANASIATLEGFTPLHFAVQAGHFKIVVALINYGVNICAKDKHNATPLFHAAQSGHTDVAKLLIKNGANVNDNANNNLTPLHIAARNGHKDITELLISNKADVRAQDIKGSTPLHEAVINGNKDIIELLIQNKADVRAKKFDGSTPIHDAAMSDSKDIIDFLIKNKAEVDARRNDGTTPLLIAILNGRKDAIAVLIENKSDVNIPASAGLTPLHVAVLEGHKDVVNLLIKNKANVNAKGVDGCTPLFVAMQAGNREIVQILVANGAKINVDSNYVSPLLFAIKKNHKEIVEVLIKNGASVNEDSGKPLQLAVYAGYRDIVEILLKYNASINIKGTEDITLLHLAAQKGHREIVNALIAKGASVDAMTIQKTTPLYLAAQEGHEEIAEILIANGASVNIINVEGAPLHIAALRGNVSVVDVLLKNGVKVNLKDKMNRTALELAVAHGQLEVVKVLLQYKKFDLDAKGNDNWTVLHIASQGSNIEIVKCLVDEGSNINAKNASGSKPIHIAAREGYKETVEYFLSKGLSVNVLGASNQTLVHYAAMKNHLEVVKYLIVQGADVNAKDTTGLTPMHIAAKFGYKDVIEALLNNGAIHNPGDQFDRIPLQFTNNKDVIKLFASTERLFLSVKRNSSSDVENEIRSGASVNAKNADGGTSLHYAAWKGYDEVVNILLQNNANPNTLGNKRCTPIHYAAKFSHLKIVKALLSYGAVYNAVSDSGKTPSDFTVDKDINSLLKLISDSFKKVKEGNVQVIKDLNKIKDIDTIKAVMNARSEENKTLVVVALHCNFPKLEQLKYISQSDVSDQINEALLLLYEDNYEKALTIFRKVYERTNEILGPNNPGTLDIQSHIATALYKQGTYHEALNMLEDIFLKQKEILGLNHDNTLATRSTIGLVLHRLGKDEKAFDVYQDVYNKQKEILGPNHSDVLATQFHMALVLERLGKYDEALEINRLVYEKRKETLGSYNLTTVVSLNNIALVLASQHKYEDALKVYKEVFEKKKIIIGINHSDTLRTLHNIAGVLFNQNKYEESLNAFQEVFTLQKKALQQNHPDTLDTQYNIANVMFAQGKMINALKVYRECYHQRKVVFGPSHPSILDIEKKLEIINRCFKIEGREASQILQHLQKDINIAASKGDIEVVQRLLNDGADINDKDIDGRTSLHYAVSNGHINTVNMLLKNGADITLITNKGNTALHTATSKGYKEIVEVLLQHISRDKLKDFVNAKTSFTGTTSLHVAAKGGNLEVVKCLLKHGATFNIKNKDGKTPLHISSDQEVANLLKLVEELFRDIKNGSAEAISKLRAAKPDEFLTITNARNNQGNTLLQVAIAKKHKSIADKLLILLKERDQIL